MRYLQSRTEFIPGWLLQHRQRWLGSMVVLSVLLFSVILPYVLPFRWLPLAVGFIPGIALLLVILQKPALGLFFVLLSGAFVPFVGPGGFNATVLTVALLIGLWLLRMIVVEQRLRIISSRVVIPLLVLIVISLLSFISGQIDWFFYSQQAPFDAQLGGVAIFILSVGTSLIVAHQVNEQRWLEWLTWSFILVGGIYIVGRLLHARAIVRIFNDGWERVSIFWIWLLALTISQAIFNRRLHPVWRGLLLCLSLGILYVGFVSSYSWKSGWLPPMVGVAAMIAFHNPRRVLPLLPFAGLGFWILTTQALGTEDYSYLTRVEAWKIVLEISKVNPILGLGFGNYRFYAKLFPILGWYVEFNSHSQYVDLIAQTGFLGLICFLWIFWEFGRLGWWLRERVTEGFAHAYVYGALGGLVGTIVAGGLADWVLPFVYNVGLKGFRGSVLAWLFMGGLVSLEQIYRNQQES